MTSLVFAACMFAGWVPSAVYAKDVKDVQQDCDALAQEGAPVGSRCDQLQDVESALAATAVGSSVT